MIQYLTSIDLNQNEMLRMRFQNYAGDPRIEPVPGVEGQPIWDSVNNILYTHNGTTWELSKVLYSISAENTTGAAILRLTGSDGSLDDVTLQGDSFITVTRSGASLITFNHGTNDGQLHVPATLTSNNGKYLRAGATAGSISWDTIDLGTDTTGNYVASLIAGTGVTITNNTGEGTTPTISIGQDISITANPTFAGVIADAVQIGVTTANEINTTSGDLVLDSASGTTLIDDNVIISGNLTVNGSVTTVNTETLSIADNIIVLNSNEVGTPTQNAGIEVERGTSASVSVIWSEAADRWEFTNDGSTFYNLPLPGEYMRRFVADLSSSATQYVLTHNLNTQDATVTVREIAPPYATVFTDVEFSTLNTITIRFNVAPSAGAYRVTVVG